MLLLEALHQQQFVEKKSGSKPLKLLGTFFEDALKQRGTHTRQLSTLSTFQHCTLHELRWRETKVSIISDFLPETMHSRRQWGDIFRVLKGKKKKNSDLEFCIQRNYPSKVKEKYGSSQRSKSRPALQETVLKVHQREGTG